MNWPDARGWIGLGSFTLTVLVLVMVWTDSDIRGDEFFKVLATLIVGGFVKDVLGWAYQATKSGGELADKNAAIVHEQATASATAATTLAAVTAAALPEPGKPTEVKVVNPPDDPANVTDAHAAPLDEQLPEHAR